MKIRRCINFYNTKSFLEILRRVKLYKNYSVAPYKKISKAVFIDPPGEISNEQFDDTIWFEAYCNAQTRTIYIPKEIILDFLYNNGYKDLFEDETVSIKVVH